MEMEKVSRSRETAISLGVTLATFPISGWWQLSFGRGWKLDSACCRKQCLTTLERRLFIHFGQQVLHRAKEIGSCYECG